MLTTPHKKQLDVLLKLFLPVQFPLNEETKQNISRLIKTFKALKTTVGLAAPQIGPFQCFFVFSSQRDLFDKRRVFNPTNEKISAKETISWEGFLSSPLKSCKRHRTYKIKGSYYTEQGTLIKKILEGEAARIFQHECDPLKGLLGENLAIKIKTFHDGTDYKNYLMRKRYKLK